MSFGETVNEKSTSTCHTKNKLVDVIKLVVIIVSSLRTVLLTAVVLHLLWRKCKQQRRCGTQ